MESKIWFKLWLQRGVNRRTIDQTVVHQILLYLSKKNDWLPVTNSYSGILDLTN
jgi:hypothetical protein